MLKPHNIIFPDDTPITYIMFPGNRASMRVSTDITGEVDIIPFLKQKYDCSLNLKLTNNIP